MTNCPNVTIIQYAVHLYTKVKKECIPYFGVNLKEFVSPCWYCEIYESSEVSILNIYVSFFLTGNISFVSVLHLLHKLFHLFTGIEKNPLINNEVTSYVCTEKINHLHYLDYPQGLLWEK